MKSMMFNGLALFFMLILPILTGAQDKFSTKAAAVTVAGTSTMHDWEMKASNGECTIGLVMSDAGQITDVSSMTFSIPAKALKSGKDGMDKNAYKALKADKNPTITATLKSATISTKDNITYTVNAKVNLTIAGKTLETPMVVYLKPNKAGTVNVTTEKKLAMKDYGMDPPSFMLGAVKTGNEVTLKFNFNANRMNEVN